MDSSIFRTIPEKPRVDSSFRLVGQSFSASQDLDFYIKDNKVSSFTTDSNGNSTLTITSPINPASNISAEWYANISMREDYGIDLLPNRDLGVRVQIDQYLGNGDGNLSMSEISEFVEMIMGARNLSDSEAIGCCLIDYSSLTPVRDLDIIVYPPAEGSVSDSNGSWGWVEYGELTGTTDSRTTRTVSYTHLTLPTILLV